ncbi:MAG: DUF456 family protein [Armatimonadetes bacterium]|nr:DUF456 family protein [Armatimonadota bacterium]MDW8120765.1 DUF456 family protein [Armatimonadota bacterium]
MDWGRLAEGAGLFFSVSGAMMVLLGLPGTFFAWLGLIPVTFIKFETRFALLWTIGGLSGCLAMEALDNFVLLAVAVKMGASRSSAVVGWIGGLLGALLGGTVGGILGCLSGVLGGLIGAFGGGFLFVWWWEKRSGKSDEVAVRAALGTVLGRLLGITLKIIWIGLMTWFALTKG